MLAAGIVTISIDLGVSVTDVALLSGYQLLVVGASGYFTFFYAHEDRSSVPSRESSESDLSFCFLPLWG
jgi:hypothetical protein